jgi:hypothetical protein
VTLKIGDEYTALEAAGAVVRYARVKPTLRGKPDADRHFLEILTGA